MKKLLSLILGLSLLAGAFGATFACETAAFPDGDVCIDIDKNGNDYTLSYQIFNYGGGTPSISCSYQIVGGQYDQVGACNGTFETDLDNTSRIKLYMRLNGDYGEIYEYYDFDNGERSNGSSSNNLDDLEITANPDEASEDEWIDITVEAVDSNNDIIENYNGDIVFTIYRKSSSSSSRSNITSREGDSGYFYIDSDYDDNFADGIDFSSSRNGDKEFRDFIKFDNDNYDYKIEVEDYDDSGAKDYDIVEVGSNNGNENSDVDGFTNAELETVDRIYDVRPRLIDQLKEENRDLRYDNERDYMSDDIYDDMKDVLDNDNDREFDDYDKFFESFEEWYSYTLNVIH